MILYMDLGMPLMAVCAACIVAIVGIRIYMFFKK